MEKFSASSCCPDSALSTTASITGILTFALGLFASYIALISATRGAPAEIRRLVEDLRTTQHEINRVAEYIYDDAHYSHGVEGRLGSRYLDPYASNVLKNEVQLLLKTCVRLFYEADVLLKKSELDSWDLRRRLRFVLNGNEVVEKMRRLQDQKSKLAAVQMSLFLKKSALQDVMLQRIVSFVEESGIASQYESSSQVLDNVDIVG
ncbi:hypothetical protein MMC12_008638 [Toensbergia leucococca]|nr:hypothetical protein [Toensbergia leucococca]